MVLNTLKSLLGLGSDDSGSGVAELKAALREPRTDIDLEGVTGEPYLDPNGANTAVIPVEVYEADQYEETYTTTRLEFEIEKESGKDRLDSFLAALDVDSREDLEDVEDRVVPVSLDGRGNIKVNW